MSFDELIIVVMALGIIIGGFDRVIGNKFGLGEKFEEGFYAMGPIALGMVGIVSLSPVIADVLGPVLIPVFGFIGADPAVFASILAIDMGGYQLALDLASDEQAGVFSGAILASMLGCTLVFSIPVGLGLIEFKDRPFFAKGLLAGLTTIPFGGLVGGLVAGYDMGMILVNLVPVIILSTVVIFGLIYFPNLSINCALLFARFLVIVITIGLAASAFEFLTGIVLIPGMAPIMDGIEIVGSIGIILLGAFPIVHLVIRVLKKPLEKVGEKFGMDSTSAGGIVISIANSVPVYPMIKDMNNRGKVINVAWIVPATAVLGDHLGFIGGVNPDMIVALISGKVAAGILAIGFAYWLSADLESTEKQSEALMKEQKGSVV